MRWTIAALFLLLLFFSCRIEKPPAPPVPVLQTFVPPVVSPNPQAVYHSLLQGDTVDKQREIFRLGYRFLQEKNRDAARAFFTRALEVYPPLADYSLYYLGRLNREEGRMEEARASFLRLLTDYLQSIWVSRAAMELAALALSQKNWEEAIQYAQQARASRTALAATRHDAALILAQAHEEQGALAVAYSLYQELRRTAPRSAVGKTAKAHVERLRALEPDHFALRSDQEYLSEIHLRAQEGDGAGVEDLVKQFPTQFPASPLQPEVLSVLAEIYKQQGRTADAIRVLQEVVTQYADSSAAPAALYRCATFLWNADRDEEALVLFERMTKQYPNRAQAAEAWYAIGRIFQERQDDTRASAAFQHLATLFPGSQLAREGRWRQAWMAYRRSDFAQAEKLFTTLARSAPNTAEGESALYWQARAIEQQARGDEAAQKYRELLQRYPDSYYALWAEKRLRIAPPPLPVSDEVDGSAAPPLSPSLEEHYRRSQELRAIGLLGFARRELDVVKDNSLREPSLVRFFLAEYSRVEGYDTALRFAQSLARGEGGNWSRYLFPQAYWEIVTVQAEQKRLDPYLVLALMRQESVFDPEAVSPAQAYGLMQLLPSTAAKITASPAEAASSLTEPKFNLEVGTTYLRQLLDRYGNNLIMTVAAYNGGENAVDKWRKRHPELASDEFVESISFRETRNYVKQVLRNYRTYLRLYEQGSETRDWGLGIRG